MTKQEINRILDSYYKEKQIQISLDFNERFNNAFESFPKFKELELNRRKLVLQTINNPDDEKAKIELLETKKQLSSFIKENHIDLTYKVSCQKCNDKGRTKDGICACRKTNLIKMLKAAQLRILHIHSSAAFLRKVRITPSPFSAVQTASQHLRYPLHDRTVFSHRHQHPRINQPWKPPAHHAASADCSG